MFPELALMGKSKFVKSMMREVIIRKMKDLSFCHLMHKVDEQVTVGVTRRFSIAAFSNNDLKNSGTRAIFVFDKGELPEHIMDGLSSKFKLLKVLDFENSLLSSIPDNLWNLFHLRWSENARRYWMFEIFTKAVLLEAEQNVVQRAQNVETVKEVSIRRMRREFLDFDLVSATPHLRVLKYLVKLRLGLSNFEDDPH
ncbi:unnamed protein product [Trifolium pratense]|uniref:Uncharacterized protein n=1 Tax=Trifolium pratense TaxID=57577 RepID=A0ACB0J4S2_TRIPR|nr:unnamed protein product [Trifolium pratense]